MSIKSTFKNILGIRSDLVAADAAALRHSIASLEQIDRAKAIHAELTKARANDEDYQFPSERPRIVCEDFGVSKLSEVPLADRLFAERAAHDHGDSSQELKGMSGRLQDRRRAAVRKAAELVSEIRTAYIPLLEAEQKRYREALTELFAQYEVEEHVDSARPIKRLAHEHKQHSQLDPEHITFGHLGDSMTDVFSWYFDGFDKK